MLSYLCILVAFLGCIGADERCPVKSFEPRLKCNSGLNNCTGVEDGTILNHSCWTYTECLDGEPWINDCHLNGLVFSENTCTCERAEDSPYPCCKEMDCVDVENGDYADHDNDCRTYYTCFDGIFSGHQYCEEGLVFDERLKTCNWKNAVAPPCGTLAN